MNKILTEIKLNVRYAETDQMGVVYHGNYAQYLEVGRIDWLDKLGFSYKKMEDEGVMLPVVNININYKHSAKFGDELTIKTFLKKLPTAKIIFEYEIYNQEGKLLADASSTLVFISVDTRKPIKCPTKILETIKEKILLTK